MGYNRGGARRKARLRRHAKEQKRLAKAAALAAPPAQGKPAAPSAT